MRREQIDHFTEALQRRIDFGVDTGQRVACLREHTRLAVEFDELLKTRVALRVDAPGGGHAIQIRPRLALDHVEQLRLEIGRHVGVRDQPAIDRHMAEIQARIVDAHQRQRLEHQRHDFQIAVDMGIAEFLGAHLQRRA